MSTGIVGNRTSYLTPFSNYSNLQTPRTKNYPTRDVFDGEQIPNYLNYPSDFAPRVHWGFQNKIASDREMHDKKWKVYQVLAISTVFRPILDVSVGIMSLNYCASVLVSLKV